MQWTCFSFFTGMPVLQISSDAKLDSPSLECHCPRILCYFVFTRLKPGLLFSDTLYKSVTLLRHLEGSHKYGQQRKKGAIDGQS